VNELPSRASALERFFASTRFEVGLALASLAVCFWYLPYGLPTPDAGAALVHATRIADGAVFYRDLDAYPLPGSSYLLAAAMKLFGERLEVARTVAAITFTMIVIGGYRITVLVAGRSAAALCGLWLISLRFLAYPAFHDSLYPDWALLFALWSILFFLRYQASDSPGALWKAGLLGGMTLLCKQNLGLYLGATISALILVRGSRVRRPRMPGLATFAAGAGLPIAVAIAYFGVHGVLGRMIYSGFVRPFSGYLPTGGVSFSEPLQWWEFGALQGPAGFPYSIGPLFSMLMMEKLPLHAWYPVFWNIEEVVVRLMYTAIPAVFVAAAIAAIAERRPARSQPSLLVCVAACAAATIASAFPRADYYHISNVYPVVLVLAFASSSQLLRMISGKSAAALFKLGVAATASVFLASMLLTAWFFHGMTYVAGNARGHMRVEPENAWIDDVIRYLETNLDVDDGFFVYGQEAYYYFFTGHYPAWPFVQLYPGMTGNDDGKLLADRLAASPPRLVVRGLVGGWAGLPGLDHYASHLSSFIDARYRPTAEPFTDGQPPDAQPPPEWLLAVLQEFDASAAATAH
jgi:hypothetical protein